MDVTLANETIEILRRHGINALYNAPDTDPDFSRYDGDDIAVYAMGDDEEDNSEPIAVYSGHLVHPGNPGYINPDDPELLVALGDPHPTVFPKLLRVPGYLSMVPLDDRLDDANFLARSILWDLLVRVHTPAPRQ